MIDLLENTTELCIFVLDIPAIELGKKQIFELPLYPWGRTGVARELRYT